MKRIKFKFRKVNIQEISDQSLLINLYFTQALILLLAVILMWFMHIRFRHLFIASDEAGATIITYGILFAAVVLLTDYIVARWIPKHVSDDGGMNERIFANRPLWHLIIICLIVSICEEVLFRGTIQNALGVYWTSVVFTAIHVRYLRHWLMTLLVFGISYGLGWIYIQTGTLITPIIAHFIIDFVLGYHLRGERKQ